MPDEGLMGLAEVADLLGVSTQRVDQLAHREDFPRSIAELKGGRIWRRRDIEAWAKPTSSQVSPIGRLTDLGVGLEPHQEFGSRV
jgi:predicted DNA-binding transcriptional regulator AlpA